MQPIGEPVRVDTRFGRGTDSTAFKFFQCRECGSIWMEYEDSGAGGHGTFTKRLTEGFF